MSTGRISGFTLIELMVTIAVAVILMSIAAPAMQDMIASQRVRSAASELMTDMSYARGDAVSNRRQVAIMRLEDVWSKGWRVVACVPTTACSACTNTGPDAYAVGDGADPACLEEPLHRSSLGGRIKLCTRMNPALASVDTPALIFNVDGRLMDRAAGAPLHINAFMVSDHMGDADPSNDKLRALEFDHTGRVSLHEVVAGGGTACP